MDILRVTILKNDSYESFIIPDVAQFLEKLRACPKISAKYKKMDAGEFRQWVEDELTPKQFEKLQKINNL
jgi:hypothetical protein